MRTTLLEVVHVFSKPGVNQQHFFCDKLHTKCRPIYKSQCRDKQVTSQVTIKCEIHEQDTKNLTLLWWAKNTKWPFRSSCLHVLKGF